MVVDHICVNFGADLFGELFSELQERGVQQRVFYPRNKKHRKVHTDRPYHIESPLILGTLTKVSFQEKQRRMRQYYDPLFQETRPDLIHAHTLFSDGSLAYHYHKKYHTPYMVAIRSSDMDVFMKYKPWLVSHAKQIVENASYVICISPTIKKQFLKKFGDRYESRSRVLPNGIHPGYFRNPVAENKEAHTAPELLYVGSFLKRKNVTSLIKLVQRTDARLTLVGQGGGHEKYVLRKIRNDPKITYLGTIGDPEQLSLVYRQSDIFIMTSRRETFGRVYLEAMSQGTPLIYSLETGIDGFFEEGSVGYGVSPGSLPEMEEAMTRILANYREISGKCISEAGKFKWEGIADSYMDLYQSLFARTLDR
jgi:glycosyltransferase involved in cell wall biosynthesis